MKRVIACFVYLIAHCCFACTVVDDLGRTVNIPNHAERIVALAPNLTELLFAVGAGSQIVGVMRGSDYPKAAQAIPVVADYHNLDLERLLAMHPDLIVALSEQHISPQLQRLSIPIYFSQITTLAEIPTTLQRLGCLTGHAQDAKKAADDFTQATHALAQHYSHKRPITVFYEVWSEPLLTVTEKSWINDVITLCGGRNPFAHLPSVAPPISLEAVLLANPTVILSAATTNDWQKMWQQWPEINAVKNNQLYTLTPDWIDRAGPRLLEGAKETCKMIDLARYTHRTSRCEILTVRLQEIDAF